MASTGFENVTYANTGAMLYQLCYEATHQGARSYLPVRSEMT